MNTKHYSLLLISICIAPLINAQAKVSWYYPKLGELKPKIDKKDAYKRENLAIKDCAAGNCESGTGSFLIVTKESNENDDDTEKPSIAVFNFILYKGEFSNKGLNFNGTMYAKKVEYDVLYKGDDHRYVPRQAVDLREESFWESSAVGTGTMIRDNFTNNVYKWDGWMQNNLSKFSAGKAGTPSSYKAYFDGDKRYVNIKYEPGGAYKEIEGRGLHTGELLSGRIRFSDGALYEGFLYRYKRFGPGRYTSADGKTEEGIWMLDSLSIPMPIELPEVVFQPPSREPDLKKPVNMYSEA